MSTEDPPPAPTGGVTTELLASKAVIEGEVSSMNAYMDDHASGSRPMPPDETRHYVVRAGGRRPASGIAVVLMSFATETS